MTFHLHIQYITWKYSTFDVVFNKSETGKPPDECK